MFLLNCEYTYLVKIVVQHLKIPCFIFLEKMKMEILKYDVFNTFIVCVLSACFVSCDRPECTNVNQIFEINRPVSKSYKDELVHQLESVDQSKLTYWLIKYEEIDRQEWLFFNVQGDGLCAIIVLKMEDWNKLEDLRDRRDVSYRGAEFINLKFEIQQDSMSTEFVYKSFDRIID